MAYPVGTAIPWSGAAAVMLHPRPASRRTLGRRIDRVSIIPGEDALGHVLGRTLPETIKFLEAGKPTLKQRAAVEDAIVSSLAGPIAEKKFTGRWNRVGAAGDHTMASDLAIAMCGSPRETDAYLRYLGVGAEGLVDAWWPDIESLADILLERKVLSGAAARRAIREGRARRLGIDLNLFRKPVPRKADEAARARGEIMLLPGVRTKT